MGKHLWRVCVVGALGFHAPAANAQISGGGDSLDRNCLAALGNVQIGGNLFIASRCELDGTDVRGNVTLFAGGSLTARNARIRGNLSGSRANFVDIERSRIDGTVTLEELVGDLSTFEQTQMHGNVELRANRSRLETLNNDFGGNLLVLSNTGGVLLSGNAVDDDLRCTGNTPAPVGVGNRVDGAATGQCQNLQPETPPPAPAPPAPPTPAPTPTPTPAPTPDPSPPPDPAPPPASSPPPAAAAPPTELIDEGGAGAMGWPMALLLSLLAWRRASRRYGADAASR